MTGGVNRLSLKGIVGTVKRPAPASKKKGLRECKKVTGYRTGPERGFTRVCGAGGVAAQKRAWGWLTRGGRKRRHRRTQSDSRERGIGLKRGAL